MAPRVLLLKAGVTSSRAVLGDYEVWFSRAAGVTMHPVELHAEERAPDVNGFDAVIMTGSPWSVTAPVDWMKRAGAYVLEAAAKGRPVLGVCFGHQLLAWAHGATVVRNPLGRELGTVRVSLSSAGARSPLFTGFPGDFEVQATHEDVVLPGAAPLTVLTQNAMCAVQAFVVGPRTFGVQFHPEMDAASIQFCVDAATERASAVVRETPWGARLLERFIALVG